MNFSSKISKNNIFLIDGLGALVSAFMHGFILVQFQEYIGMPIQVLIYLSILPIIYASYSLFFHFSKSNNCDCQFNILHYIPNLNCIIFSSINYIWFDLFYIRNHYFIIHIFY